MSIEISSGSLKRCGEWVQGQYWNRIIGTETLRGWVLLLRHLKWSRDLDAPVRVSTQEVDSAVISSGAHMSMVAMVDNASGICKAFIT